MGDLSEGVWYQYHDKADIDEIHRYSFWLMAKIVRAAF